MVDGDFSSNTKPYPAASCKEYCEDEKKRDCSQVATKYSNVLSTVFYKQSCLLPNLTYFLADNILGQKGKYLE